MIAPKETGVDFYPLYSRVVFHSAPEVGSERHGTEAEVVGHYPIHNEMPKVHTIRFDDGTIWTVHPNELSSAPVVDPE